MREYFENYDINTEIDRDEISARTYIILPVMERLERRSDLTIGKNWYELKIIKTPTRTNYHKFSFESLQDISRKFTNGLQTFGLIPNRIFFNRNFKGGIRTTSIFHTDINGFPSFSMNYLLFSDIDNIDMRYKNNIINRIKQIDPSLETQFRYLGKTNTFKIEDFFDLTNDIDLENENVKKLDQKTIQQIMTNEFQKPRFLGDLYKKNNYENTNYRNTNTGIDKIHNKTKI